MFILNNCEFKENVMLSIVVVHARSKITIPLRRDDIFATNRSKYNNQDCEFNVLACFFATTYGKTDSANICFV